MMKWPWVRRNKETEILIKNMQTMKEKIKLIEGDPRFAEIRIEFHHGVLDANINLVKRILETHMAKTSDQKGAEQDAVQSDAEAQGPNRDGRDSKTH